MAHTAGGRRTRLSPYWTAELYLGEAEVAPGERREVRLKLHRAEDIYPPDHLEIVSLQPVRWSERPRKTYVHAKPYYRHPVVAATGRLAELQVIGHVDRECGNAQGWYYNRDRLIVLWEALLWGAGTVDPRGNQALALVWDVFECYLGGQFPDWERIVTPSWDPEYEEFGEAAYHEFLRSRGFRPVEGNPRAFEKLLRSFRGFTKGLKP